jgi:hypothetical protein
LLACAVLVLAGVAQAAQLTINGPPDSGEFGRSVTTLPNGNIVITDPRFDAPGPVVDVGAVYLYRPDGTLISTLRGGSAGDQVGSSGVTVLSNGNYVVISPLWDNGAAVDAGAVTFGSGTSGISGVVSSANSLVGSTVNDRVGVFGITALSNGNYVVRSPDWDNGAIANVGAATFGSGTNGINGVVSPANSLVGSTGNDIVGSSIIPLSGGNYVVRSQNWDNGAIANAGAVTFGSGTSGVSGMVSSVNSLIGSTANDFVGAAVAALSNGNYVVLSHLWTNGAATSAGAVTFGSGTTGISGVVSPANSLVGSTANDQVGSSGVAALSNGNYVVQSPNWDNGAALEAGAVTFGSGISGISGVVSPANSLVGSTANDQVGAFGMVALSNSNYVVISPNWDNGAIANVGAATFGLGTSGISGIVSPANSLVGSTTGDSIGTNVTALSNGNYVVRSRFWDNGAIADAGAATFGSGTSGISGVVSSANSLVGSTANDQIGSAGVTALSNGNYVVRSRFWDNGAIADAGAATFGSGTGGISGVVSSANSLVGSMANDQIGSAGVTTLSNGNYVVRSQNWDNGATVDAGAVTFGSGASGILGVVSPANSLVGSATGDQVGAFGVTALHNGNYVVRSPNWDNGAVVNAGAITLGLFDGSVVGAINSTHSVLGAVASQGTTQTFAYDAARNQLVVGEPASNRVILHRTGIATAISIVGDTPDPSNVGQAVTFTATVNASPSAPMDGQVTFVAVSGETCVDTTPTATSDITVDFSCKITFTTHGTSIVVAEYTGSIVHAYSGSGWETHATVVDAMFFNGFESR